MAKKTADKINDHKPRRTPKRSECERIEELECRVEKLMSVAADLQTSVDKVAADVASEATKVQALKDSNTTLTAQVADMQAQIVALQAVPPVVEQAQLDANVASLNDSASKLEAL